MKMFTSVQNPSIIAAIDVQYKDECAVVTNDDNEITLTKDKTGHLFRRRDRR